MKKTALALIIVILVVAAGCRNGRKAAQVAAESAAVETETYLTAIDKYLTDSIAPYYTQGAMCIPFCTYISADESNPDQIEVLGDFWVLNYVQDADTLKTISGGNHAGKMTVAKNDAGHYEVVAFDQVLDGSELTPSAQRIFGEKFDEYAAASSNELRRRQIRAKGVAEYVRENGIPAKYYKDYGWPAVEIPAE